MPARLSCIKHPRRTGVEKCLRYQLIDDEVIELTFECIPRRDIYKNRYVGLFWAATSTSRKSEALGAAAKSKESFIAER